MTTFASVCPVCSGRGFMSRSFYSSYFTQSTAIESNSEVCRSCNGLGYIWNNSIECSKKHCKCEESTTLKWHLYDPRTASTEPCTDLKITSTLTNINSTD